jgi:hypothetical protein
MCSSIFSDKLAFSEMLLQTWPELQLVYQGPSDGVWIVQVGAPVRER